MPLNVDLMIALMLLSAINDVNTMFYLPGSSLSTTQNQEPFVVVWNAPTNSCDKRGVHIDVKRYGMKENADDNWMGAEIALFYTTNLGLYPFFDAMGNAVNGGLPQLGNLSAHLEKASNDIVKGIPSRSFSGLGVIDWESWRPTWERNYDVMFVYRQRSIEVVRKVHPDWSEGRIEAEAKRQFETAARLYMEGTLSLGRRLRPGGQWGFYGFPNCYNYQGQVNCSTGVKQQNDRLVWLYEASSALFPSAYISLTTKNPENDVRGHVAEARRVRQVARKVFLPIYLYSRYQLADGIFYTKADLNYSIEGAANMGVDGVVVWGSSADSSTCDKCVNVKNYIDGTLGAFVADVINTTKACSQSRCSSHGRCVNISEWSNDLSIRSMMGNVFNRLMFFVSGGQTGALTTHCECYDGWVGDRCGQKRANHRTVGEYFYDIILAGFNDVMRFLQL